MYRCAKALGYRSVEKQTVTSGLPIEAITNKKEREIPFPKFSKQKLK